jgi:hypothetical protein
MSKFFLPDFSYRLPSWRPLQIFHPVTRQVPSLVNVSFSVADKYNLTFTDYVFGFVKERKKFGIFSANFMQAVFLHEAN